VRQVGNIRLSVSGLESIEGRLLVIFDGHCGLCNRSVRWLLVRDREDRLRFVASESAQVAEWLALYGFGEAGPAPGTILVVRGLGGPAERILARSNAILEVLGELPRPWPAVATALGWIPRPLRDLAYRLIARWRYHIWGRLETCPLPAAGDRQRFL
jgi:predicted DCC family thiol-disulfide oxidoreductase YuxK